MKTKKLLSTVLALSLVLPITLKLVSAEESSKASESETSAKASDSSESAEESKGSEDAKESEAADEKKEEPAIKPRDLGGITLRYLNLGRGSALNPEAKDLKPEEVEERKEKLAKIEKDWNVKLKFTDMPQVEWKDVPKTIAKAHAAGDDIADLYDLSRVYLPSLVRNKAIADLTDVLKDAHIVKRYIDTARLGDHIYGAAPFVAGEGIFYNRKMIKDAGMEKTPSEMFAEGEWSYADFTTYLEQLASKLPEGTKPFFVDPYYWMIFAPAGNGCRLVDLDGHPHYTDPGMIETLELLKTLQDKGLLMAPIKDEKGEEDYWSTPAQTFEKGTGVAMTHRASWQAAGLVDKLDFGFVPYPWGSNVKIDEAKKGQPDAYKTLSENYAVSAYDAATFVLRNGIEELGKPEDIFYFLLSISDQDYMVKEWEIQNGQRKAEEKEYDPRFFSNELDVELYEFSLSRERFEPLPSLSGSLKFPNAYYDVMAGKNSVRAAAEAQQKADEASLDKVYGRAPMDEPKSSDESKGESESAESKADESKKDDGSSAASSSDESKGSETGSETESKAA